MKGIKINLDELNQRYAEAAWEIQKRSGKQFIKSIFIGQEKLDELIAKIAKIHELSEEESRLLRPIKQIDTIDGGNKYISWGKNLAGAGVSALEGKKVIGAGKSAYKSGRLVKAGATLLTKGGKAALQVAKTGKTAAKVNPWILTAQIVYIVGSTGWLFAQANKFNRAVYNYSFKKYNLCSSVTD